MLRKDEWLSQYFNGGAYVYHSSDQHSDQQLSEGFVYTKIPLENLTEMNALIKQGFNLVEVLVLFEQKIPVVYKQSSIDIGLVRSEEKTAVVNIAKNAFITSRLYQDARISHSIASQIKGDWVSNFFHGLRGDRMIVARVDNEIAGFLLLVNATTIDLIAVSPDHHRKNIASTMIAYANQHYGLLKAGTQLNNKASIAMYEKCGFMMKHAHFVLHKFYGVA